MRSIRSSVKVTSFKRSLSKTQDGYGTLPVPRGRHGSVKIMPQSTRNYILPVHTHIVKPKACAEYVLGAVKYLIGDVTEAEACGTCIGNLLWPAFSSSPRGVVPRYPLCNDTHKASVPLRCIRIFNGIIPAGSHVPPGLMSYKFISSMLDLEEPQRECPTTCACVDTN